MTSIQGDMLSGGDRNAQFKALLRAFTVFSQRTLRRRLHDPFLLGQAALSVPNFRHSFMFWIGFEGPSRSR